MDADEIASLTRDIFDRYSTEKAVLFGSFARGHQSRKSDIDLVLIQRTQKPFFERYEGILRDLYQVIKGRDIEVLIYTPEELKRIAHRKFIQTIFQEGKIIYGSGQGKI